MTDITIPTEALKAAKRDAALAIYRLIEPDARAHELTEDEVGEIARAACLAMLKAWPGMRDTSTEGGEPHWQHHLILPLTQEKTNAEG